MFLKYYMHKSQQPVLKTYHLPWDLPTKHIQLHLCVVWTLAFFFFFLHKHLLGVKVHSNKFCGTLMPTDCSV